MLAWAVSVLSTQISLASAVEFHAGPAPNTVPIGKDLPQLDHTLKQLADNTVKNKSSLVIGITSNANQKGYRMSYHVGRAKVSLVATNATQTPQSQFKIPLFVSLYIKHRFSSSHNRLHITLLYH
jgi:hypothetical protein